MKAIALLATIARRRRLLRLGNSVASYALSTFTTNDWDFTADNVDDATDTLTVYDTNGVLMVGATVVLTSEDTLVDAAECTLASDVAEIEATTGTANITAYVLNAAGVPLPGIPAASLSLASTGTGNTITAVNTVTDHNGRFRWTFSSTVSEAKTLTLTALGIVVTDTVAVTVGGAPAAVTPDFFSDWSTATGTGASARSDGSKWDVAGTGWEVIAKPAALVATMTNVLQVPWDTAPGTAFGRVGTPYGAGFSALAVGETRTTRWYMSVVIPDSTADAQTHPVQDGNGGSQTNWSQLVYNNPSGFGTIAAGYWRLGHGFWNNTYPNNAAVMDAATLEKNHWYRFEVDFELVTSTTFRFYSRVYDAEVAGEPLLYDSGDFTMGGLGSTTLEAFMASNTLTVNDDTMFDGMNIGSNDQYSSPGDLYALEAGVAVWTDQRINVPYGEVTGE